MQRKEMLAHHMDESSVVALNDRQVEDVSGGVRFIVPIIPYQILRAAWAALRAR
ncbi:MAG: hypothetical protein Q4G14_12215 [Paracoccus sp. (in: a-proteobacteria)]|uniref:hypothetical protein n=1 Tax=Paracoccus sp. TaxID=267 RepID=UPI0026E0F43E|nr:hypothetical protein [Paracoccus sp. (in: a-proteobacteria)]MDO5613988.1 hypothetical protein [Paracoccus sp. (in: a-proteobacteria)]